MSLRNSTLLGSGLSKTKDRTMTECRLCHKGSGLFIHSVYKLGKQKLDRTHYPCMRSVPVRVIIKFFSLFYEHFDEKDS